MSKQRKRSATKTKASTTVVPADLRGRLEAARLDLRALYRSLDRMQLAQEIPRELRRLQRLDADFAEALWALDHQEDGMLDVEAMAEDTLASLSRLPAAREQFFMLFSETTRERLEDRARATRGILSPEDAYLEIPGRDPSV